MVPNSPAVTPAATAAIWRQASAGGGSDSVSGETATTAAALLGETIGAAWTRTRAEGAKWCRGADSAEV